MITTELYNGQGLGNQLACYVLTRVIALDKGYEFGIMHPERFKGLDFMRLDFGLPISGGNGPDGGPPTELPNNIVRYYEERKTLHPINGSDIRLYDTNLTAIADGTKIDGLMQGEDYIGHRKGEIRQWLQVDPSCDCLEYADDNTCIINFRGGEYARHPEFFLRREYWLQAIRHMRTINPLFRFVVITDDVYEAKKCFPEFDVFHFSIGKDYTIIKNAHYLILSNSTFGWFPAWLNENLKYCIAPKYWARHNVSDGYWSLGTNLTNGWYYMDREGVLFDYTACKKEFETYVTTHPDLYSQTTTHIQSKHPSGVREYLRTHIPQPVKRVIKSAKNEVKYLINLAHKPFDVLAQKRREKAWLSRIETAEYRKKIKIFDAFNFFNELEVLDIRLHVLAPSVDTFVIVESPLTHSGKPKPLYYQENKERFAEFADKIFHYVIEQPIASYEEAKRRSVDPNTPESDREILVRALSSDLVPDGDADYLRDFYEKEYVLRALQAAGAQPEDFCYVSDLDEVWNPATTIDWSRDDIFKYKQDAYIYYLNNRSNEDWHGWCGTIATKFKNIVTNCLNDLRMSKVRYTIIRDGGWHFTFQGGLERIKQKLAAYSYHELNDELTGGDVEQLLSKNKDLKGRFIRFWKDESKLPTWLLAHKDRFPGWFR